VTNSIATGELQRRIVARELDFQGASLSGVNLRGANLIGANLSGASLRGANLHAADLRNAKLMRTDLGMADVGMADFGSADLNGADFRGANLKGANFNGALLDGANLRNADLHGGDLRRAKLVRVDLSRADLRVTNLSGVDLRGSDLRGADLSGANLAGASLMSASLHEADLRSTDMTGVNLRGANLTDTRLDSANLAGGMVGGTVFADLDLRAVKGLETLRHGSPSTLGTDTLARSRGSIPEIFLMGCGLSLPDILAARHHDPDLTPEGVLALLRETEALRARSRAQRKRVLISHSQQDDVFVEELRRLFLARGVYGWVAAHELKGTLRERQSKLAIQHDVALLLVLSQHSVQSDWAEHEVRLAKKLEKDLGEPVLCPISLDDAWKTPLWQGRILENIAEERVVSFADWRNGAALETQVSRLLEGMGIFYP
jgi:uncharacterized protein YjbI with pentapeptide repeats